MYKNVFLCGCKECACNLNMNEQTEVYIYFVNRDESLYVCVLPISLHVFLVMILAECV